MAVRHQVSVVVTPGWCEASLLPGMMGTKTLGFSPVIWPLLPSVVPVVSVWRLSGYLTGSSCFIFAFVTRKGSRSVALAPPLDDRERKNKSCFAIREETVPLSS